MINAYHHHIPHIMIMLVFTDHLIWTSHPLPGQFYDLAHNLALYVDFEGHMVVPASGVYYIYTQITYNGKTQHRW